MLQPCLLRPAALCFTRSARLQAPCRYKSVVAAIERGRNYNEYIPASRYRVDSRRSPREQGAQRFIQPTVDSLPYTTAASEFLYGYSSVLAALKARRRQIYHLYVHTRGNNHIGRDPLIARAKALRVGIKEVGDGQLSALDRVSKGRPHNVSCSETASMLC